MFKLCFLVGLVFSPRATFKYFEHIPKKKKKNMKMHCSFCSQLWRGKCLLSMVASSFSTGTGILYFTPPLPELIIPAHFVNQNLCQFTHPAPSLRDRALSSYGASFACLGQSWDTTVLKGIQAQVLNDCSPGTRQSVCMSSIKLSISICKILNGNLLSKCVFPSHLELHHQTVHRQSNPDHFSWQSGNNFVILYFS